MSGLAAMSRRIDSMETAQIQIAVGEVEGGIGIGRIVQ
jgi:hypothetical protein